MVRVGCTSRPNFFDMQECRLVSVLFETDNVDEAHAMRGAIVKALSRTCSALIVADEFTATEPPYFVYAVI